MTLHFKLVQHKFFHSGKREQNAHLTSPIFQGTTWEVYLCHAPPSLQRELSWLDHLKVSENKEKRPGAINNQCTYFNSHRLQQWSQELAQPWSLTGLPGEMIPLPKALYKFWKMHRYQCKSTRIVKNQWNLPISE